MYENDGQRKDSRFHDIIHNVNNDGLEDMAWPGALARQKDNGTKGKEEERSAKTTQTQTTTQTQEKPSDSSPKSKPVAKAVETKLSKPAKVETNKETVSDNKQPKPKSSQRHDTVNRQDIIITDEWSDFQFCLDSYDSREEGAERHSIYLPDKVYNTYQTVFSRGMSAAISVILQRFIDRNKGKMLAVINKRSDLLQ